jgi:hypothetical protein
MGGAMDLDDGMGFVRVTMTVMVTFAVLAAGTGAAHADARFPACGATSVMHARKLADDARQQGDHRRAAQCYREAGDDVSADRAMAKAFAVSGAKATKKASAMIDDAKAQARRIKEALRAKPGTRRS